MAKETDAPDGGTTPAAEPDNNASVAVVPSRNRLQARPRHRKSGTDARGGRIPSNGEEVRTTPGIESEELRVALAEAQAALEDSPRRRSSPSRTRRCARRRRRTTCASAPSAASRTPTSSRWRGSWATISCRQWTASSAPWLAAAEVKTTAEGDAVFGHGRRPGAVPKAVDGSDGSAKESRSSIPLARPSIPSSTKP